MRTNFKAPLAALSVAAVFALGAPASAGTFGAIAISQAPTATASSALIHKTASKRQNRTTRFNHSERRSLAASRTYYGGAKFRYSTRGSVRYTSPAFDNFYGGRR